MRILMITVLFLTGLIVNAQVFLTPNLPKLGLNPAETETVLGALTVVKDSELVTVNAGGLVCTLFFRRGWFQYWDYVCAYGVTKKTGQFSDIELLVLMDREESLENWKQTENDCWESKGGLVAQRVLKGTVVWIGNTADVRLALTPLPKTTAVAAK